MRIALDPVPLVLGIYAHVGALLGDASREHQGTDPEELGRRFGRQREEKADREVQRLVRALHSNIKTADKLLKKTGDIWKISQETDLVDLVVHKRGEAPDPPSYILLRPAEIQPLLLAVAEAGKGTGEADETVEDLRKAAADMEGRGRDYLMFGFAPWEA